MKNKWFISVGQQLTNRNEILERDGKGHRIKRSRLHNWFVK